MNTEALFLFQDGSRVYFFLSAFYKQIILVTVVKFEDFTGDSPRPPASLNYERERGAILKFLLLVVP